MSKIETEIRELIEPDTLQGRLCLHKFDLEQAYDREAYVDAGLAQLKKSLMKAIAERYAE